MRDNWELVSGQAAQEIEVINIANQLNVIEALCRWMVHHFPPGDKGCPRPLDSAMLKELHRTATLFLLQNPGKFRQEYVSVISAESRELIYEPPSFHLIDKLVQEFELDLGRIWENLKPLQIAAFTLWKINWIHPFKNGNGRTARAFSYACLCLKLGGFLPGAPTVMDQILGSGRPDYYRNLRWADITFRDSGVPDLEPMVEFLGKFLIVQLESTNES